MMGNTFVKLFQSRGRLFLFAKTLLEAGIDIEYILLFIGGNFIVEIDYF